MTARHLPCKFMCALASSAAGAAQVTFGVTSCMNRLDQPIGYTWKRRGFAEHFRGSCSLLVRGPSLAKL